MLTDCPDSDYKKYNYSHKHKYRFMFDQDNYYLEILFQSNPTYSNISLNKPDCFLIECWNRPLNSDNSDTYTNEYINISAKEHIEVTDKYSSLTSHFKKIFRD